MHRALLVVVSSFVLLTGCATARLSAGGERVVAMQSEPGGECTPLGTVIGEGGGSFGGSWISNAGLVDYAINDARNQAADMGATHVHLSTPALGSSGSDGSVSTTTATVVGTAYRCVERTARAEQVID